SITFFFSSRRRHTSFSRDWSSDVCSSDLADDLKAGFTLEKSFSAWVAKARFDGDAVIIAKPTTYMNRSGQAAGALMRFYKLVPDDRKSVVYDHSLASHCLSTHYSTTSECY